MNTKVCKACGTEKPLDQFYTTTVDGNTYHRNKCKVCYRAGRKQYDKEFRAKRQSWLREIKDDLECERCGFDDHPVALDFHHDDPEAKDMSVGRMVNSYSKSDILAEMEKCTVLCANCHRIVEQGV